MRNTLVVGQIVKDVDAESVRQEAVTEVESLYDGVPDESASQVHVVDLGEVIVGHVDVLEGSVDVELLHKVQQPKVGGAHSPHGEELQAALHLTQLL